MRIRRAPRQKNQGEIFGGFTVFRLETLKSAAFKEIRRFSFYLKKIPEIKTVRRKSSPASEGASSRDSRNSPTIPGSIRAADSAGRILRAPDTGVCTVGRVRVSPFKNTKYCPERLRRSGASASKKIWFVSTKRLSRSSRKYRIGSAINASCATL